MTSTSVLHAATERHNIHAATCRPLRQGLACSACSDLLERLLRALRSWRSANIGLRPTSSLAEAA